MRTLKFLTISIILVILLSLAGISNSASARPPAATAPGLGTAGSFVVLGGSTVTNTGTSILSGDLGVSPGTAITGFPPGIIIPPGAIHDADATALQAQNDLTTAFNALTGQPCTQNLTGQDLGLLTLTPGVYCFDTSAQITGTLTLNAQGNPDSVFVFKIGSTLTTASNSSVSIINGGSGCNVFWQIGSSATLGTKTSFQGNILALTSITLNTGAVIIPGRALARNGAVTLDTNQISCTVCTTPVVPAPATQTAIAATISAIAPTLTSIALTTTPISTLTRTPTSTSTPTITPTSTPTKVPPTATLLPKVAGFPNTGGGPIQNDNFPWILVILGGCSAIALGLGIRRRFRSTNLPKQ